MNTPAIVIFRDRVTYARQCIAALDQAGCEVHIVDHGTTWQPALDWLSNCPYPVYWRGDQHPRSLWDWDRLPHIIGTRRYIVTDPDTTPALYDGCGCQCPTDWLQQLHLLLDNYPGVVKAGLSLTIDDLPDRYEHRDTVVQWEGRFWAVQLPLTSPLGGDHLAAPAAYSAPVDTTLALYPPLTPTTRFALAPAIRSAPPYTARHLTWYENTTDLPAEIRWYRDRLPPLVSHWADPAAYTA